MFELTDAAAWRAAFEPPAPLTIGIEDEVMIVDGETLDLVPRAAQIVDAAHDPRIRLELPAAQLELVTGPAATVAQATAELAVLRAQATELARARGLRLAAAGAHPFAAPDGVLNERPRDRHIAAEYGPIARRQLVFGLHVHLRVRGADRALAVFDALREHLPTVAALAANAPLFDGGDSGLSSVRPTLSGLLPRQGIPPALHTWDAVADDFAWGRASGRVPEFASWWWEARLHPTFGTIEVRVPDAQTTVGETAAVAAVLHALAAWLAARHDGGDLPPPAATWRIAENRWSAARHGLDAVLCDLRSGRRDAARDVLGVLFDALAPHARELGADLGGAHVLAEVNGALRLREAAAGAGITDATRWLCDRFTA
jgi:carboxylate-amine ligase